MSEIMEDEPGYFSFLADCFVGHSDIMGGGLPISMKNKLTGQMSHLQAFFSASINSGWRGMDLPLLVLVSSGLSLINPSFKSTLGMARFRISPFLMAVR
jgi:hypothetical protein